jgi:hypothetical protein
MATLLTVAAISAEVAQSDVMAATHLDPANLPCTPSCPNPLDADRSSVPPAKLVLKEDGFDWGDAGVGAAIGVGAMLAGLAGAFEARKHRIQPR